MGIRKTVVVLTLTGTSILGSCSESGAESIDGAATSRYRSDSQNTASYANQEGPADCGSGAIMWQSDGFAGPAVAAGDQVFVLPYVDPYEGDATLYALSLKTGSLEWSFSGVDIESPPVIVNGQVLAGTGDGRLVALAAESGDLLWDYRAGQAISSAVVADGNVA